jgi:tetratricopeptide (TPR) repeat protein
MNKRLISIAASLVIGVTAFAQEKEIEKAEDALKNGNLEEAKNLIHEVKITDENSYSFDPEIVSEYLYVKGNICNAIGEKGNDKALLNAAKVYSKLVTFEKGTSYSAKNKKTGDYEYFKSQADLDAAVATGNYKKAKVKEIKDYHSSDLGKVVGNIAVKFHQSAIDAYNKQEFVKASENFVNAYDVYSNPLVGKSDTTLLYNAAAVAISAKEYSRAADLYNRLIDMNYTGVTTVYEGTNKESGETATFASKKDLNMQVKLGLVENDTVYTTKNNQPSMYRTLGNLYLSMGDEFEKEDSVKKKEYYHKALEVLEEGKDKFPGDYDLLLTLGNTYLKEGNNQGFVDAMKEAIAQDPNNEVLYYNIGVVSNDLGMKDEAKAAYKKAIEIKPDYTDAYINLAAMVLGREKEINEEISALPIKLNKKNRDKLKSLKNEKTGVYKEAITYLEGAYEYDKKNSVLLTTMKNIYYALDRNDDFMRVKKELDALNAE